MSKRQKPTLRAADNSDFYRMFGQSAPQEWMGYVCEGEHMLLGIGGAFLNDGRWWAFMLKAPGTRPVVSAQRGAKMLMKVCDEADLTIHALADPAITGSDKWLRFLGFSETDEQVKGWNVWTR